MKIDKNKIILILLLIAIILCFFNNNTFASFDFTLKNGDLRSYPDLPKGNDVSAFIYRDIGGWVVMAYTYSEGAYFKIISIENDNYKYKCYDKFGNEITFSLVGKDGRYTYWKDYYEAISTEVFTKAQYDSSEFCIKGTVYNSNGTIFFQATPLTVGKQMAETLAVTQVTETLKTMITGFLKYLIVLVISVIAFWKGWQFLLRHFKTA